MRKCKDILFILLLGSVLYCEKYYLKVDNITQLLKQEHVGYLETTILHINEVNIQRPSLGFAHGVNICYPEFLLISFVEHNRNAR